MRYQPTLNGRLYTEVQPLWDYFTRTPHKTWHRRPMQPPHVINHWRDIEGSRLSQISKKDLHFSNWFRRRIREEACLPLYYSVGYRFICITQAFPAGFKCEPLPLNLAEARGVKAHHRQLEKEAQRLAKQKAKEEKIKKQKLKNKKR